jgi:hypothetical protein
MKNAFSLPTDPTSLSAATSLMLDLLKSMDIMPPFVAGKSYDDISVFVVDSGKLTVLGACRQQSNSWGDGVRGACECPSRDSPSRDSENGKVCSGYVEQQLAVFTVNRGGGASGRQTVRYRGGCGMSALQFTESGVHSLSRRLGLLNPYVGRHNAYETKHPFF